MFLVILTRQMRTRFYTYFLLFFFAIISVVNAKNDRGITHTLNIEKNFNHFEKNQHSTGLEIRSHRHSHSKITVEHPNNFKYSALLPDHFHYKVDLVEAEVEITEVDSNNNNSDILTAINLSKLYLTFLSELYTNSSPSYRDHSQTNNLLDTLFIVYRVIRL
ncbi:hypothetical protein SAMN05443634_105291 [Chishuiella changwenlii]|uniref:Uncharacterized protein n=2 Tax=Chishuiella changwenlii TaxID=1434701 RepID=A0A1M6XLM0_9FLAO|nr:hypothetical protein GCM10010984_18430 [Chishuiella changwenlii]SHL06796.1 hypothetical protein SAMN05443634_105291 [Chishuiella changwenlii]